MKLEVKSKFYAQLKNNEKSIFTFNFSNSGCEQMKTAPDASKIIASFNSYMNNTSKSKEFRSLLKPYKNNFKIVFKSKNTVLINL